MRLNLREVKDKSAIDAILNESVVMRIAMRDEEGLYIVPVNFGYTYENGRLVLYAHGAKEGRKISAIEKNGDVAFEIDCAHRLHVGETACKYSYYYKSIIGNGNAKAVEDTEEKKSALSIIMKHVSSKDFVFDDRAVSVLAIIRIDVVSFTAKQNNGI